VDVPIARTWGVGTEDSAMSDLEGFTTALDAAIQSGFIVSADRQEILEIATATYHGAQ
jgi:hypothetical protein